MCGGRAYTVYLAKTKLCMGGIGRWEEGQSLSKYQNAKGMAAPVAYVPRPRGLGLGAQPSAPPEKKGKIAKSGEPTNKPDLVIAPDSDGKVRCSLVLNAAIRGRVDGKHRSIGVINTDLI